MKQRNDLIFPLSEYQRRVHELRQRLSEHQLDALITTTPENIFYLSGFESPGHYYFNAMVVPLEGESFIVPRQLENLGVQELTWLEHSCPYQDSEDPIKKLKQSLHKFGLDQKRIGYEKNCWFFTALQQEKLFNACSKSTFVDVSGIIESGRLIKSDLEIEQMSCAAKSTEAGMRAGIKAVVDGANENDVAAEIHYAMIKAGSHWPSIVPFVASGPRGAIGHATWMGRKIEPNEFVFLELSGCINRYHAPLMRTVYTGEPNQVVLAAEQLLQEAMAASISAIKPDATAAEVDAVNREMISNSQFGAEQASRSAYSVGIGLPPDWGEGHILSLQPGENRVLKENMTFHLIPWIQLPGQGGIGFTETVRVTKDGCELLTNFERKLFLQPF